MSGATTETDKLYKLLSNNIDALPEGAQSSTRARLDGLKAMTASTDAAYARVAETAYSQAAARPADDAALKAAMQTKILGMKPITAVLGAVAVGGLAVAAIKLTQHRHETPRQGTWADRIATERVAGNQQGRQF